MTAGPTLDDGETRSDSSTYKAARPRPDVSHQIDEPPPNSADRQILVVEDHEPTARLIATVIEDARPSVTTHIVGDGKACLTVLRGEAEPPHRPDLVLLDLDIPVVDGLTVLETSDRDPAVPPIPTIVLSGRGDPATVEECYQKGANAFISKPDDLDQYDTLADNVVTFWFSAADLPRQR